MGSEQSIVATVVVSLSAILGLGFAILQWRDSHGPRTKYAFFLSHHKGGAGNTARLMKLLLSQYCRGSIFFDTDNLTSLDLIFDAVRASRHLVVILSGETTQRPWCVGELVVAYMNGVPIIPIVLPFTASLPDSSLLVPDAAVSTLRPYGITADNIRDALHHVLSVVPRYECATGAEAVERVLSVAEKTPSPAVARGKAHTMWTLVRMTSSRFGSSGSVNSSSNTTNNDGMTTTTTSAVTSDAATPAALRELKQFISRQTARASSFSPARGLRQRVRYLVIGDSSTLESASAVTYARLALQAQLQEPVRQFCGQVVSPNACHALAAGKATAPTYVIICLTPDALKSPALLAYVALASRLSGCILQPLVCTKEFAFPSAAWFDALETRGEPIGASVGELERTLAGCLAQCRRVFDGTALAERLRVSEVAEATRALFMRLALPFDINYTSETVIKEQTTQLLARLKAHKRDELAGPEKSAVVARPSPRGCMLPSSLSARWGFMKIRRVTTQAEGSHSTDAGEAEAGRVQRVGAGTDGTAHSTMDSVSTTGTDLQQVVIS